MPFSVNFWMYLITRTLSFFFYAIVLSNLSAGVIEITPLKHRGVVNAYILGLGYTIGGYTAVMIAKIALSFEGHWKWRIMLLM